MSNGRLLITSLVIIAVLAGVPHLFAAYTNSAQPGKTTITYKETETMSADGSEYLYEMESEMQTQPAITGYWTTKYDIEEFKGEAVYHVTESERGFVGHAVLWKTSEGEIMDHSKVLDLTEHKKGKWTGKYSYSYDGTDYNFDCMVSLLDTDRLELRYDYEGYFETEIWTRTTAPK